MNLEFSVEIFPPSEPVAQDRLVAGLAGLAPLGLSYVSVTYGAGGTTRERTLDMVDRVMKETPIDVAAHLTCVSASCVDVDDAVRHYRDKGIRRIVALRGDPPGGLGVPYTPHPEGYQRTADLVAGIRRIADFDVSVAAYPEKHPQSRDLSADLDTLEEKVEAGACRALTQFFFENEVFLAYLERVRSRGITVPVVPGILPVVNFRQLSSFVAKCGATIPARLAACYEGLDDDPVERARIGADVAAAQIAGLVEAGQRAFHIYCLNRPEIVHAVWERLGLTNATYAAA